MKKNSPWHKDIEAKRIQRAWENRKIDTSIPISPLPNGAVSADHEKLNHINTYGRLPKYYVDIAFKCRDCGVEEIWKAEQQKWYYEEVKGHIDSTAVRCRACRKKLQAQKAKVRKKHLDGLAMKNKKT